MAREGARNGRWELAKKFLHMLDDETYSVTSNKILNKMESFIETLTDSEEIEKCKKVFDILAELTDYEKIDRATTILFSTLVFKNPAVHLLTREFILNAIENIGSENLLKTMSDQTPNSEDEI